MVYFNLKNTFIQIRAIGYVKYETLAKNMHWYLPESLYMFLYEYKYVYPHIIIHILVCKTSFIVYHYCYYYLCN